MASRLRASLQPVLRVGLILLLSGTAASAAEIEPSADELMQRGLSAAERGALEQAHVDWKAAAQLYDIFRRSSMPPMQHEHWGM